MKINCTDLIWGDVTLDRLDYLPHSICVDLEELGLDDVTEENSSIIADWISDETGECLITFDYHGLKD